VLQMLRVLRQALSEASAEAHPEDFLIDASRQ
jgi:hypothetical protein